MKTCFVTFASYDSVRYQKNLKRLKQNFDLFCPNIPLLAFTNYKEIDSPTHQELNYGFKVYAIKKALSLGFTKIVWIDSAVYPIMQIDVFLNELDSKGIVFFDNIGHPLGFWANDACLAHYGIDRAFAKVSKQIMGCLFGFDINTPQGFNFWSSYEKDATNKNIVNGSWDNHRHDQAVASCILIGQKAKLLTPNETYLAYKDWYGNMNISEKVCFNSQSF